jgi:hypothetical protein
MRKRWQLILPAVGLVLFGGVTYQSMKGRQYEKAHGQYFWWASIRLDTHHVDRDPETAAPCKAGEGDCVRWDPVVVERYPGWSTAALMLSALPAFLIGIPLVRALGHLGVNELWAFMLMMPLLVAAWYYAVGWVVDHRIDRRSHRTTPAAANTERPTTND